MLNHSWRRVSLFFACAFFAASVVHAPAASAKDKDKGESASSGKSDSGSGDDRVVLTFATVGDSRQDPKHPDPSTLPVSGQDQIWLQNTKALARIIRTVRADRMNFLFFNGDMIMGYGKANLPGVDTGDNTTIDGIVGSDLMAFYRQYAYWRGMMAGLMETGTYVVPVPGNHEMQWKAGGKKAQVENENAWRANMGDLILDKTRFENLFGEDPTNVDITGPTNFATSQKQLDYSFDFRGSHFVIINTDPVGNDAHAPTDWLESDLSAAKARGAGHFFVFGHKPAYTYYFGSGTALPDHPAGLDNFPTARDDFWAVIEKYNASYFCGHEHIFHFSQPTAADGGHSYQFLVGSGGSPFEAAPSDTTLNPATDRDYAWAEVKVYKSGKVKVTAYGFDESFGKTTRLETVTLTK